ncbi:coiled-coil domain-containing protein 137 [Halichoeres trimaculatus]|uniref:coiled-coil domain-containing protein 137 n=1 Tax=Halichoeres trimaculatus TaxID=147232 RepID=UPI003D9DFF03
MGKSKKNKTNESVKQASKAGQHSSDKKHKRDGQPKKPRDHLEHIPFRLREIMKSKERLKAGPKRAKKLPKAISSLGKHKEARDGDIPVPHFKRGKKESVKAYLRRMNNETRHVLFLTKNQVERKPELEEDKQEKPADKGKSEKKKEYDKVKVQKTHQKKLDRQQDILEKEMFIDDIPFGEVSMAPPSLSIKPKKAPVNALASKKLHLHSLLGNSTASTAKPSMARQRIMEEERQRAVEAYRYLKKQKQLQNEARTAGLEKLKNLE